MKFKKNGGFTLVELIVVIAILAILAGVAVPAYTGYIQKADKAADLQLLGAVNTAFGAACMEQQISTNEIQNAYLTVNSDGTVGDITGVTLKAASAMDRGFVTLSSNGGAAAVNLSKLNEAFDKYMAGNAGAKFKVITLLSFSDGAFGEAGAELSSLAGSFNQTDIDNWNDGRLSQLGMGSLMNKVDLAAGLASSAEEGSELHTLVNDISNYNTLAQALGYESIEADGAMDAVTALAAKRAEALAAVNGGNAEDYMAQAGSEILANNTILTAATSPDFSSSEFANLLASGDGKKTIKDNLNKDPQTALAQAAMAYAMYTSYNAYKGNTISDEPDIDAVLDTIATDDFKDYMANQSSADVTGYQAAMNMISTSASNKDAVSNLLVNGFNNGDLLALLNQATSQTGSQE